MAIYKHIDVDAAPGGGGADGSSWDAAFDLAGWQTYIASMTTPATEPVYFFIRKATNPITLTGNWTVIKEGTSVNPVYVIGVKSTTTAVGAGITSSDYAYGTDRPTIAAGSHALNFSGADYWLFRGLNITTNSANGFQVGSYNYILNCKSTGSSNCTYAFRGSPGTRIIHSEGSTTKLGGSAVYLCDIVENCYFHDSSYGTSLTICVLNSIFCACPTAGVALGSGTNYKVIGNTIYGCGTGIAASSAYRSMVINNIISQCTTAGAVWTTQVYDNYLAGNIWNNTTNVTLIDMGETDNIVDVGTTVLNNPAAGDFSLKSGDMRCRSKGVSLTTYDGLSAASFHINPGVDQTGIFLIKQMY